MTAQLNLKSHPPRLQSLRALKFLEHIQPVSLQKFFASPHEFKNLPLWLETFGSENIQGPKSDQFLAGNTQWNPFNQRIILYSNKSGYRVDNRFDQVFSTYFGLMSSIHEATHVMLFEPFYIGKLKIRNYNDFLNLYFGFEGAAVWHAEHVLAPLLKIKYPDGESWRARCGTTQKNYSNIKALQSLKSDSFRLMNTYIESYRGRASDVFGKNEIFVLNMAKRFYRFHVDSLDALHAMYENFKSYGIFDQFQKRFLMIENLPTFLSPEMLLLPQGDAGFADYCFRFLKTEGPRIESNLKVLRDDLRMRRDLQTRAYFVFLLSQIIKQGHYFSTGKSQLQRDVSSLKVAIENYLLRIEEALHGLARREKVARVRHMMNEADRYYSSYVRKILIKQELWISRRSLFLNPEEGITESWIGLVEQGRTVPLTQVFRSLVKFVLLAGDYKGLIDKQFDFLENCHGGQIKTQSYNRFLSSKAVCRYWSRPLSVIDPESNIFEEISLIYG